MSLTLSTTAFTVALGALVAGFVGVAFALHHVGAAASPATDPVPVVLQEVSSC
uniref:hypothetical protein n=1 Tax=Cellulomonas hominis TaxID=156981 RepID=UPI0012B8654D|nr:hypothetical protein [Cellulomonas hominis]